MRLHNEALALCFLIIGAAFALTMVRTPSTEAAPVLESEPTEPITIDVGDLNAKAVVVFDVVTGEILAAKNENEVLPIASVTKLFTAATLLDSDSLEQSVTITWSDVATEGRAGKLQAGEEYTVRELLWPLMLESSNDAAAALERTVPGLLNLMNADVQALGASQTQFADGSGLSPGNVSTAKELARLTRRLYQTEPHLFDIARLDQYLGKQTGWINNSPFAKDKTYLGGKHGFTDAAGRTGVALFTEGEQILGYVVLGSNDLKQDVNFLR